MSTSLLYHAFGIIGYFYQSTRYLAGAVIVAIKEDRWRLRCPGLSLPGADLPRATRAALSNGPDWAKSGVY